MLQAATESWRCCDASAVLALKMASELQVENPVGLVD
jgi:hypothetical protein